MTAKQTQGPKDNTKTGMIRAIFESATSPITSKHLPEIAEQTGFDATTVRLQFYRWRKESNTPVARMCRRGH